MDAYNQIIKRIQKVGYISNTMPSYSESNIDHIIREKKHNLSLPAYSAVSSMRDMESSIGYIDMAMFEFIERLTDDGLVPPMLALVQMHRMVFANSMQTFRTYWISLLQFHYVRNPDAAPEKLGIRLNEVEINDLSSDMFKVIDQYYGPLEIMRAKVIADVGVDLFGSEISYARMRRLNELRNCQVHHSGRINSTFLKNAGSKVEKSRGPKGLISIPKPKQVIYFVVRSILTADKAFTAVHSMPRQLRSEVVPGYS